MWAIRQRGSAPGLALDEVPVPAPADDGTVEAETASFCGTDLPVFRRDARAGRRIVAPRTLGHEFAGSVVQVGHSVRHDAAGDDVSAESRGTGGACYRCHTAHDHLASRGRWMHG